MKIWESEDATEEEQGKENVVLFFESSLQTSDSVRPTKIRPGFIETKKKKRN